MAIKKKTAKPAAKKAAKPAPKKASKPAAKKPAAKPAPKKAAPKPAAKKPVAKPARPNGGKPAPKPTPKVTKPASKPVSKTPVKPVAKKEEKKPAPAPKPVVETAIKPTVKQAIQNLKKEAKEKAKKPAELKPVKTSVSTSVKYQPDFTRSVLDSSREEEKPQGPIVRYSDADLTEFRELIQRKLEAAKKELLYLQGLITRKDEMGGDDGDGRYMTMEDGSVSMEREQLSQMASRQITYIDHLEKALMRIENKTYGICRVTGKLIDKARLRAVPHATLSIEAKMGVVKGPQPIGD
ncbi:MAG TPA: TraR/DksA C4-type zinc finger protein [Lacibacter sp.]|nr:TraR/DksA C4-type zinc finger protein [Lacibacter sp.]